MKRVAAVIVTATLGLGGVVLTASPAAAAAYTLSSCQANGTGTPPAGLDQLTFEVTGTAPATAVQGEEFVLPDVSVAITNPHPYPIDGNLVGFLVAIPPGASAFRTGFQSPSPFSIPANGTLEFGGSLIYVSGGAPGSVLEFRPSLLSFSFGPTLGVNCTVAGGPTFASTVVLDEPGYQFTCSVPSLGITLPQTIDVVGTAPATAVQGAPFALTNVISTSSSPITTTVHSTTFSLANPVDATPLSPLSITIPGPFPVQAGVPFASAPMSFDFAATGPPGAVIEFRPGVISTEIDVFGAVNCVLDPGQPPFATTTIVAPLLDEIAIGVVGLNGELVYLEHEALSSGDFAFTRDAHGRIVAISGMGAFPGADGGEATLRVRYRHPSTTLRLHDVSVDIDLRASSLLPVFAIGTDAAVGGAVGRLDGKPVFVLWFVRDRV